MYRWPGRHLIGQKMLAGQITIESAQLEGKLLRSPRLVSMAEIILDHSQEVRKRVTFGGTTSFECA